MLIDFHQVQLQKFIALATQVEAEPEHYLHFDSVSDFYKASWLKKFPAGTIWYASGLDDGAEEFHAVIEYREAQLLLSCGPHLSAKIAWKH